MLYIKAISIPAKIIHMHIPWKDNTFVDYSKFKYFGKGNILTQALRLGFTTKYMTSANQIK